MTDEQRLCIECGCPVHYGSRHHHCGMVAMKYMARMSELEQQGHERKVGVVEGLEMAALYHDAIAEQNEKSATWHENGSPSNGAAMAVVSHKKHAGKLRAMKPNLTALNC